MDNNNTKYDRGIGILTGPQFANFFRLRHKQLAWFLGAGASASAGIPTGYAMINDFKKRLFCQLSGVRLREVDANDPLWMDRINFFFSKRSELPSPGDPAEYAAAFEAVYPTPEDRRSYIEEAIKKGTPSFAHKVLASLLTTGRLPCVFTTNFDPLVETATIITDQLVAANDRAYLTVAAIDSAGRAELCLRESRWPLLAKLHGDYQSVELKNTAEELKEQDTRMRQVLTGACARFGLVVVGYSGRDDSVMEALTDALSQADAFPGGIFWVSRSVDSVLPAVTKFLKEAAQAGISVAIVESQTFDELAADIADGIDLSSPLQSHVYQSRPEPVLRPVPLPTLEKRRFPVLQCSALPILSMPTVARRVEVSVPITTVRAREMVSEAKVRALVASNGRHIVAFGSDDDLVKAFASLEGRLAGTVELHPNKDSWALGLIYDALTRAICRGRPLFARMRRHGHYVLVANSSPKVSKDTTDLSSSQLARLKQAYSSVLTGKLPKLDYPFNEGVQLRLELMADRWWCMFEPVTQVEEPRTDRNEGPADDASGDFMPTLRRQDNSVVDWRRERWATRYNPVWARIISAWAVTLAGEDGQSLCTLGLQEGAGHDAVFQLSPVTAWSRPSHEHDYFQRGRR
jgi:NAD-dependent SIR2 family protein deacetylase